jgi:hypothetical protein
MQVYCDVCYGSRDGFAGRLVVYYLTGTLPDVDSGYGT